MTQSDSVKFVRAFALTSIFLLSANAFLNRTVDPFGAYGGSIGKRLQDFRYTPGSRIAKAEMARRFNGSTVFVGSSRTEVAFDPHSPAISDGPACNLGLSSTNFHELAHVIDFAIDLPTVRKIVLCLDFHQFDTTETVSYDFQASLFNPELSQFDYHCNLLIGDNATRASVKTIRAYTQGDNADVSPLGHRRSEAMKTDKSNSVVAQRLLHKQFAHTAALQKICDSNERFDALRQVVERCRQEDVQLVVLIQPLHATFLELHFCAGLWDTYERWLDEVVRIVNDASGGEGRVWDFTTFGTYASEPMLTATGSADTNHWFWEPSHCKTAMGDEILKRIAGAPDADPGFGRLLSPADMPNHLAELRAAREAWRKTHRDARLVAQLVREGNASDEDAVATRPDRPNLR